MIAFRLELRRDRGLTIWLAVALAGYGAVMGLMYPIMQSNDELMRMYMETFPKEFLAAFGMTGSLADPGIFFTTYISSWLWPIIAAAAGLGIAHPPDLMVAEYIARGELKPILTDFMQPGPQMSLVYPSAGHQSPKVRVFSDFAADLMRRYHDMVRARLDPASPAARAEG